MSIPAVFDDWFSEQHTGGPTDTALLCCPALEVDLGQGTPRWVMLDVGCWTVGRDVAADVHVPLPDISRVHVRLTVGDDGQCLLEDLRSTNGTTLNGHPIGRIQHTVGDGDVLKLGQRASMQLHVPGATTRAAGALDPVSGALHHRIFASAVDRLVRRIQHLNIPVTMGVVDVNALTEINAVHGAAVGDAALRCLATRLQEASWIPGAVARLNGGTFVVLLAGEGGMQRLQHALDGLRVMGPETCVLFQATAGWQNWNGQRGVCAADLFLGAVRALHNNKAAQRRGKRCGPTRT